MKHLRYLTIALLGATALASTAQAQTTTTTVLGTPSTEQVHVRNEIPLNTLIILSGTIARIGENENFVLDHGNGIVNVNTAGWKWHEVSDDGGLKPGDHVTVSGMVRENEYTGRQLMAETVQLHNEYTYFFEKGKETIPAGVVDVTSAAGLSKDMYVSLTGVIVNHDSKKAEFTLRTATNDVKIDISDIDRRPFDNEGKLRLNNGDQIRVYGEVDNDFLKGKELEADRIIILQQAVQ